MEESNGLGGLGPHAFEHLVNALALRVLGLGATGFALGPDGGRDGYFEGEAAYPSSVDRWRGRWYIQSKFRQSSSAGDQQAWLLKKIEEELHEFAKPDTKRQWPDVWIVATNVETTGVSKTGAFDRARELVRQARPHLGDRFDIWGGRKILDLLNTHADVRSMYLHLLTSGHVLEALLNDIGDARAEIGTIIHYLIVRQMEDQQHTKLEQAGSAADTRPGIHRLFMDLPFRGRGDDTSHLLANSILKASSRCLRFDEAVPASDEWRLWERHHSRARLWFVKGGPGQGKSTVGQFVSQVQRAAIILRPDGPPVLPNQRALAQEIRRRAEELDLWPEATRLPLVVELKEFAQWYGERDPSAARGVLTYVTSRIQARVEQTVTVGTLRRALKSHAWLIIFDGLDEVPQDVKDSVASEVKTFLQTAIGELRGDILGIFTSRPQGYSGQFDDVDCCGAELVPLNPDQALRCAKPVLELGRSADEATAAYGVLQAAIESGAVRDLMTTPLQSHIMAIIVRDGGKPPDRRWQLYSTFYSVIKRREANRSLPDKALAKLLREDDKLLKAIHNRLGFVLHARAETSSGAQTKLSRQEFEDLARQTVSLMLESDVESVVNTLMKAVTERLVLVSTPDDGNHVRFDIRQLQEFFAAEFMYEAVSVDTIRKRVETICGDAHWREVAHFLVSAFVENNRLTELAVTTDVLRRLDDNSDYPFGRIGLKRRAAGAVICARLLAEGVLEQDKRIRQQFRDALEPIGAVIEANTIRNLASINQPRSRAWFAQFLIDVLKESSVKEALGAALLLPAVVGDDDVRIEECALLVDGLPLDVRGGVIAKVASGREHYVVFGQDRLYVNRLPLWFFRSVVRALLEEDWWRLGPHAAGRACYLLRLCGDTVLERVISTLDLSGDESACLRWMIGPTGDERDDRAEPVDYGMIIAYRRHSDWRTLRRDDAETLPVIQRLDRGLLTFASDVFRLHRERRASNLHRVMIVLRKIDRAYRPGFPERVANLIPINLNGPISSQLELWETLDDRGVEQLLGEGRIRGEVIPRPIDRLEIRNSGTLTQWKSLVSDLPVIALLVWNGAFAPSDEKRRPRALDSARGIEALVNRMIRDPELLRNVPGVWGYAMDVAKHLRDPLLRAIRTAAEMPVEMQFGSGMSEIELKLPEDRTLLPHLLAAMMTFDVHERRDPRAIIARIVPDTRMLKSIYNEPKNSADVRGAAIVALALHPSGEPLVSVAAEIVRIAGEVGSWYFRATAEALRYCSHPGEPVYGFIVGGLCEAAGARFECRDVLGTSLVAWREYSSAPVSSGSQEQLWLSASV